ncbi:hypothetical protein CDQ92_10670 [Sphingopyxis bauzanensis]|uniref:Uncharacterized protein n=1 Tax=Sphingopyxis bauzanensis TaxID=651663 RepID=A0A246JWL5_9SPHN|nr:hypothetical protein CDQ92_10670 [Sphingopyxis bauzanensis]
MFHGSLVGSEAFLFFTKLGLRLDHTVLGFIAALAVRGKFGLDLGVDLRGVRFCLPTCGCQIVELLIVFFQTACQFLVLVEDQLTQVVFDFTACQR